MRNEKKIDAKLIDKQFVEFMEWFLSLFGQKSLSLEEKMDMFRNRFGDLYVYLSERIEEEMDALRASAKRIVNDAGGNGNDPKCVAELLSLIESCQAKKSQIRTDSENKP